MAPGRGHSVFSCRPHLNAYINVWPEDVHSPFFPPGDRRGDGSKRARYLGVLDTMDEQLGELFDYEASCAHESSPADS